MVRVFNRWLPTSYCLVRRGMDIIIPCFCCNMIETLPHLFLNGPVAIKVWDVFHKIAGFPRPNSTTIITALSPWFNNSKGKLHIFHIISVLIMWFLWCCRNDKRMKAIPFMAERVCEGVWKYLRALKVPSKARWSFWKGAGAFASRLGGEPAPKKSISYLTVIWAKPCMGRVKLNTDGAAKGNPGCAASGGIVRNHLGSPLLYFSEFLGDQTNTFAELHAISRGLDLCFERGFENIWVEVDSKVAIRLLSGNTTCQWKLQALVAKIRNFLSKINIRVSHIYREGNGVADLLANRGCERRDFYCANGQDLNGKILGLIRLDKMSFLYIRCKKIVCLDFVFPFYF
ncbi:hypothetical protein OROMI_010452 [Orobanche minor]